MKIRNIGLLFLFIILCSSTGWSGIYLAEAVPIGGIKQWISIKGTKDTDPVMLFLAGGPGNSAISYADKFTKELQKHFVMVQWDQRETGKTATLNASSSPLTVALFEHDTFEMINYLRARFHQDKIYIMGHSWGGFLGLLAAANHPEVLAGYLAINPMVYQLESERESLRIMQDKAKAENNKEAIEELSQVKVPFENGTQLFFHRKWLSIMMGQKPVPKSYVERWAVKWLALFNEGSEIDFRSTAPVIRCPIYFFLGSKDYQTYCKIAEGYYNMLKADKKELFWFTQSAHNLPTAEPDKLQEIILQKILPQPVK